jgi:hypothetical protein
MPASDPPSNNGAKAREAKLAQALRANLRRRKAPPAPKPVSPTAEKRNRDD